MKSYKFYRNFAIICVVLFAFATVIFFVATVKYLYLNPYGGESDSLRLIVAGAITFQTYLVYLIVGCYKKWRRISRYNAFIRLKNRKNKMDAEYSAFINNHLNY